jgi:hypothetical protein
MVATLATNRNSYRKKNLLFSGLFCNGEISPKIEFNNLKRSDFGISAARSEKK